LWHLDPHGISDYDCLICIMKAELCKGSSVGQNSAELYKSLRVTLDDEATVIHSNYLDVTYVTLINVIPL